MRGFLARMLISALGLWLAAQTVPSIQFASTGSLIAAAFWLGIVNAVVRPILVILTFPITVVTLGLFLLFINAAMLNLVAWLLEGFTIGGWGSALLGALILSLTSWIASWTIGSNGRYELLVIERGE